MASEGFKVRRARIADRAAIAAFTQQTFSWGDYVSYVWNKWVRDRDGKLIVAEADGQVIGSLHIAFCGNREAWFEGMRVHPDYRRRGVAALLDSTGQEIAREAGCRVARLETAEENVRAQAAIARFGYRRVITFREWQVSTCEGVPEGIRPATERDVRVITSLWQDCWMRAALHNLVPLAAGWRWAEYSPARIRQWIRQEGVVVLTTGSGISAFALLKREDEPGVLLLCGSKREVQQLLEALRRLLYAEDHDKFWIVLPDTRRAAALAEGKHFRPEKMGMLLYQVPLR